MTTEKTEEISTVKNMIKQETDKIIKTAGMESRSSEKDNAVSICNFMKNNTSEIIQKIESKFPTYTELYIDLYTKYLHTIDDLYSTCYVSEKELSDKSGMGKTTIHAFDAYCRSITNMILSQIDMGENFVKTYVQFRLATIESCDKVVHLMMNSYTQAWNQFNSYNKK